MHASFNRIHRLAPACTPPIARGSLSVCCAMLLLLVWLIWTSWRLWRHVAVTWHRYASARNIDIIDGHVSGHRVGPQLICTHRHGIDKYLDTLLASQTAQKALHRPLPKRVIARWRTVRVIISIFLPNQSQRSSFAVIGYAKAGCRRPPMTRAAASTRVLEYYSSNKLLE